MFESLSGTEREQHAQYQLLKETLDSVTQELSHKHAQVSDCHIYSVIRPIFPAKQFQKSRSILKDGFRFLIGVRMGKKNIFGSPWKWKYCCLLAKCV